MHFFKPQAKRPKSASQGNDTHALLRRAFLEEVQREKPYHFSNGENRFRPGALRTAALDHEGVIFNVETLDLLLNEVKASYAQDEFITVRYLVNANNELYFAREGRPDNKTAVHEEIASECIAAGLFHFNHDCTQVLKIDHESGGFHPASGSLAWPLKLLLTTASAWLGDDLLITARLTLDDSLTTIPLHRGELVHMLEGIQEPDYEERIQRFDQTGSPIPF